MFFEKPVIEFLSVDSFVIATSGPGGDMCVGGEAQHNGCESSSDGMWICKVNDSIGVNPDDIT